LYWRSLLIGIDRDIVVHATTIAGFLRQEPSGFFDLDLPPQYRQSEFFDHTPHTYYALWDKNRTLIDRSDLAAAIAPPTAPGVRVRNGNREIALRTKYGVMIRVGRDLGETYREVSDLTITVSFAGAGILILSLAGGWFLTGRALAPIARIDRTARAMAGGDLSARIGVQNTENELENVARALNDAFDQLQSSAEVQRRFTADASHELRTPLATLHAKLDWALTRPRNNLDYVEALETCRRATQRMTTTVEGLLKLTHQGTSPEKHQEAVDLLSVTEDAVAMIEPLAADREICIETRLERSYIVADASQIGEAITCLLKNAIEYNKRGGRVYVSLGNKGPLVFVKIQDTGIGISSTDLPYVFNRLYRADTARARSVGGAGLGLAIAKRIVEDHGGSITCTSQLEIGTEMLVQLPTTPERVA
jgi:signal transduction histidine kinase